MGKYHDFKKGDLVRIVKRYEDCAFLGGTWDSSGKMDWTLGKVGLICEDYDRKDCVLVIEFEKDNKKEYWNYHYKCLEKINVNLRDYPCAIEINSGVLLTKENLKFNKLKENKMGYVKILNLYSVSVVNKKTEGILVDKKTVIGGANKDDIECSIRDELIREHKDLNSKDLIFSINTLTSWEVEEEKK